MTTSGVRGAAVPLAVAVLVLAVVVGAAAATGRVSWWGADRVTANAGDSGPGGDGGGVPGSTGSGAPGVQPSDGGEQPPADQPMTRFTSVTQAGDGRALTVTFWGGVADCYVYTVLAIETADVVELRLQERPRAGAKVCIELAQEHTRTVQLTAALGGREVVDAQTGDTLLAPSP